MPGENLLSDFQQLLGPDVLAWFKRLSAPEQMKIVGQWKGGDKDPGELVEANGGPTSDTGARGWGSAQ